MNITGKFENGNHYNNFVAGCNWGGLHTWWRHQMEKFSALLALPPVDFPHKGQWRGALVFSLICGYTSGWANNRDAGDLRHYRAHYDATVMDHLKCCQWLQSDFLSLRRFCYSSENIIENAGQDLANSQGNWDLSVISNYIHWSIILVPKALQWRHNGRDCVLNHQPHDCLLNRLFRLRSKKTSELRVTGLCEGNSPGTGDFPAEMASNAEMFPFDDVIMVERKRINAVAAVSLASCVARSSASRTLAV